MIQETRRPGLFARAASWLVSGAMVLTMAPVVPMAQAADTGQARASAPSFGTVTVQPGAEVYVNGKSTSAVASDKVVANTTSDAVTASQIDSKTSSFVSDQYSADRIATANTLLSGSAVPSASNITSWSSNLKSADNAYWLSDTKTQSDLSTRAFRNADNTSIDSTYQLSGMSNSGRIFYKTLVNLSDFDLSMDVSLSGIDVTQQFYLWNSGSADEAQVNKCLLLMSSSESASYYALGFDHWQTSEIKAVFSSFVSRAEGYGPIVRVYNNPELKTASDGSNYASAEVKFNALPLTNIYSYDSTSGMLTPKYEAGSTVVTDAKGLMLVSDTNHWSYNTDSDRRIMTSGIWPKNSKGMPSFWIKIDASTSNTRVSADTTCTHVPFYEIGIGSIPYSEVIEGSNYKAATYGVRPSMTLDTSKVAFARKNTSSTLSVGKTLGAMPTTTLSSGSSYKLVAKDSTLSAPTVSSDTIKVTPGSTTATIPVSATGDATNVSAVATDKSGDTKYGVVAQLDGSGSGTATVDLSQLIADTSAIGSTATVYLYSEQANASGVTDGISADATPVTIEVAGYDQSIDFTSDTKAALNSDTYAYGQTFEVSSEVTSSPSEVTRDEAKDQAAPITYSVNTDRLKLVEYSDSELAAMGDGWVKAADGSAWNYKSLQSKARFMVVKVHSSTNLIYLRNLITINRRGYEDADGNVMLAATLQQIEAKDRARNVTVAVDAQALSPGDAMPTFTYTAGTTETYGDYGSDAFILGDDASSLLGVSVTEHLQGDLTGTSIPTASSGKISRKASGNVWRLSSSWATTSGDLYKDIASKYNVTFVDSALSVGSKKADSSDGAVRIIADDAWMRLGEYTDAADDNARDASLISASKAVAFNTAHPFDAQTVSVAARPSAGNVTAGGTYPVTYKAGSGSSEASANADVTFFDSYTPYTNTAEVGANNASITVGQAQEILDSGDVDAKVIKLCGAKARSLETGAGVDVKVSYGSGGSQSGGSGGSGGDWSDNDLTDPGDADGPATYALPSTGELAAERGTYSVTFAAGDASATVTITVTSTDQELAFDQSAFGQTHAYGDEFEVAVRVTDPSPATAGVSADTETPVTYEYDHGYLEMVGEASWDGAEMVSKATFRVVKPFDGSETSSKITAKRAERLDADGNLHEAASAYSPEVKTRKRQVAISAAKENFHYKAGDALDLTSGNASSLLSLAGTGEDESRDSALVSGDKISKVPYGLKTTFLRSANNNTSLGDDVPVDASDKILATASGAFWKATPAVDDSRSADDKKWFDDRYDVTIGASALLSVADDKGTTGETEGEQNAHMAITANNFWMKVSEYKALDTKIDRDAKLIENAQAVAAKTVDPFDSLIVSVDESTIEPKAGVYSVTFKATNGIYTKTVTVQATLFDSVVEDTTSHVRIGANDFKVKASDMGKILKGTDADVRDALATQAGFAAYRTDTGEEVAVERMTADPELAAKAGKYQLTFATANGTGVTVTCTVYNPSSGGGSAEPGNPDQPDTPDQPDQPGPVDPSGPGEDDPAGSHFGYLKARSTKQGKHSVTVEWTEMKDVDGYLIYGNKCGKKSYYLLVKDVAAGSSSWTQEGLEKARYHKYRVKAYKVVDGEKVIVASSVTVHATTTGGRYGVAKGVKIKSVGGKKGATKVTLAVGKTAKVKAAEVGSKPIKRHRPIAFESSDAKVAKVTKAGKIRAVGKGTCKVWVYAQNGVYKTVKVTVK